MTESLPPVPSAAPPPPPLPTSPHRTPSPTPPQGEEALRCLGSDLCSADCEALRLPPPQPVLHNPSRSNAGPLSMASPSQPRPAALRPAAAATSSRD